MDLAAGATWGSRRRVHERVLNSNSRIMFFARGSRDQGRAKKPNKCPQFVQSISGTSYSIHALWFIGAALQGLLFGAYDFSENFLKGHLYDIL